MWLVYNSCFWMQQLSEWIETECSRFTARDTNSGTVCDSIQYVNL